MRGKFVSGAMPYLYVAVNPYTVGLQSYWSMDSGFDFANAYYTATYGTGLLTLNPDIGNNFDHSAVDHWGESAGQFQDYAGLYYQNSCVQTLIGSFTVNFWFKSGQSQNPGCKVYFGSGSFQMSSYDSIDSVYYWQFNSSSDNTTIAGINEIDQGNWAMLTIVSVGTSYTKLYINGFEYLSLTGAGGGDDSVISFNSFGIGNYLSETGDTYDEVAVWNRALSPSEISTIYSSSPLFNLVP